MNFKLYLNLFIDESVRRTYLVTKESLELCTECHEHLPKLEYREFASDSEHNLNSDNIERVIYKHYKFNTHIMLLKSFLEPISTTKLYRKHLIRTFKNKVREDEGNMDDNITYKCFIVVESKLSDSFMIDYTWNNRLWRDCHIALERECAAAWLSTLGGGFSALGDYSVKFAKMALLTSLQQIHLAKTSNDENGIARGLLFLSLAFSQLGFHKHAKTLMNKAWNYPSFDPRHKKMCMGVQVKLQYEANIRKEMPEEEKQKWATQRWNVWNAVMSEIKSMTI